jgi:NADPH-dependent 2,4-dienoyl-CoA reductase/sulfur reductase-like enzyme
MTTTTMTTRRVLVAGASLGGLRAAEGLRANGFDGEIVVVGAEPHLPYNRPPLSKEALAGKVGFDALEFRRRAGVADVVWRLGCTVAEASLQAREVVLADGTVLAFEGLVVATGLRVRRLALPAPAGGRHALRTREDSAALGAELRPGARVVVIGAGFIGCEVAATAVGLGCQVHVVAPEQVPMQRPLGLEVGASMQRRHQARGVRMHLGRLPAVVEPAAGDAARVGAVVLDDGTRLPADVVVEALGCVPNTEWLATTMLDIADGVRTDGWLRAVEVDGGPRSDVVAVGDVARFPNALFDDVPRRVEHWSIPTDTARRAAPALVAGLAGRELDPAPFAPVPSFWSDQYGDRLQSFGAPGLGDAVELLEGDLDGDFVVAYRRAGALVGVAGIGLMASLLRLRSEIALGVAAA